MTNPALVQERVINSLDIEDGQIGFPVLVISTISTLFCYANSTSVAQNLMEQTRRKTPEQYILILILEKTKIDATYILVET